MGSGTDRSVNMADFFAMGGYGEYVWGSFGIAFVVLIANLLLARQQRRRVESEVNAIIAERTEA